MFPGRMFVVSTVRRMVVLCLAVWLFPSYAPAEKGILLPRSHVKLFETLQGWRGKVFSEGDDAAFVAEVYLVNRRFIPKTKKVLRDQLASGRYGPQLLPGDRPLPADIHLFQLGEGQGLLFGLYFHDGKVLTVDRKGRVREIDLSEKKWMNAHVVARRIIQADETSPEVFVPFPQGNIDRKSYEGGGSPDVPVVGPLSGPIPVWLVAIVVAGGIALIFLLMSSRSEGGAASGAPGDIRERLQGLDGLSAVGVEGRGGDLGPGVDGDIDRASTGRPGGGETPANETAEAGPAPGHAAGDTLPGAGEVDDPLLVSDDGGGGGLAAVLSTPPEAQVASREVLGLPIDGSAVDSRAADSQAAGDVQGPVTPAGADDSSGGESGHAHAGGRASPESEAEVLARLRARIGKR